MVSLYKDPKGEDIFKKSSGVSESLGVAAKVETDTKYSENEIRLRKKIKHLEDEMKEKDVCELVYS